MLLFCFQPLDKRCLILTVVSSTAVKIQGAVLFGAGQQHDFITVLPPGNFFGIVQALGCQSPAPVFFICYHIFNQSIGPLAMGQVGNDNAHTGGDDFLILLCNDDMVIWVVENPPPKLLEAFRYVCRGILLL